MKIEFFEFSELVEPAYYPKPTREVMPSWWKSMPNYRDFSDKLFAKGDGESTGKRCIPMADAMMAGYMFFLPTDISVEENEDGVWFEPAYVPFIDYHPKEQVQEHPMYPKGWERIPKWQNTIGMKTPPGYSTLFITPSHQDLPFRIFEGVVDTDTFNLPVAFPFVLLDPEWRGIIPAGTPIAQAIPFKREEWESTITNDYEKTFGIAMEQMEKISGTEKNGYRKNFWHRSSEASESGASDI